jgi:N-acetylglutamate synthase-like GNAT family acetyltransferase
VVVLPAYRRSGISKVLVRLREEHARKKNINHILTDVCDFQIDNFLKYGYTNLGMLHSEKIVWEVKPEDYYLMYKKLA